MVRCAFSTPYSMNNLLYLCIVALLVCVSACTEPTPIGGDIVDGTQLPIAFRDDSPFVLITEPDTVTTLTTSISLTEVGVPVGCISSPFSGTRNARVGMQIVERSDQLDLSNSVVDSIVLILPLVTSAQVGDIEAQSNLRVVGATDSSFLLLEPVITTDLNDNGILFGEATAVPARISSEQTVFAGDSTRMDTLGPEFRIPLNQSFSDAFLPAIAASVAADSLINDSLFVANFPGIIIEGGDCGETSPAIDLDTDRQDRMGVFVYYTTDSGFHRQYQFNFRRENGAVGRFRPQYVHDPSGSTAGLLFNDQRLDDTIAVLKSLGGSRLRVDFMDIALGLSDQAVNVAILEIPIIPGTDDFITPLPRIIPRVKNSIGDLVDYSAFFTDGFGTFDTREGGTLTNIPDPSDPNQTVLAYQFNITRFLQEVIDGERDGNLFFVPLNQTFSPGESILRGPGGDANALKARLLLATTDVP